MWISFGQSPHTLLSLNNITRLVFLNKTSLFMTSYCKLTDCWKAWKPGNLKAQLLFHYTQPLNKAKVNHFQLVVLFYHKLKMLFFSFFFAEKVIHALLLPRHLNLHILSLSINPKMCIFGMKSILCGNSCYLAHLKFSCLRLSHSNCLDMGLYQRLWRKSIA